MLTKVFPIPLQAGRQAAAEAIVEKFAYAGPAREPGTLSFRVYRDPARPNYLLFVEHFADQAAYDAHTGSDAYRALVAGQFADLIEEFVEIDHEVVAVTVRAAADAGAAGINIEDAVYVGAAGLRSIDDQSARISAAREAVGVDLFINARVDTFLHGITDLSETLRRADAYLAAGADGVFVPGISICPPSPN